MTAPALEGVDDTSCFCETDMMAAGQISATAGTRAAGERFTFAIGVNDLGRTRLAIWGRGRDRLTRDAPACGLRFAAARRRPRTARNRAFLRVRRRRTLTRFGIGLGRSSIDVGAMDTSEDSGREDSCIVTRDGDMAWPSPVASMGAEDTALEGAKGVAAVHDVMNADAQMHQNYTDETEGHSDGVVDQNDVHKSPALQLSPLATDLEIDETSAEAALESNEPPKELATGDAGACTPRVEPALAGWARKRKKRLGHCDAHARFLQHLFRGYRRLRPSGWRRGGLAGCPMPWRPCTIFRCRGGMCGASASDFEEQRLRAEQVLAWYSIYPDLLGRLENRRPRTYHPYCAAGADSVGVQRMRGVPYGSDIEDQPAYRMRFGADSFSVRDATSSSLFHQAVDTVNPMLIMQSPPCKAYSTADFQDRSEAPELIARSRDLGNETGRLHVIENVKGAASEFQDHAVLLYGSYFGLHVDKPRFFEANFPIIVDAHLEVSGRRLRTMACLGKRRRWRRLDPFGRPELTDCCEGNLFPIQGSAPSGFTLEEAAHAMGVDPHHMPFERLAQAIPPAYAQLVFAQACMERCRAVYGIPAITFDEMLLDKTRSRRRMHFFLRGAGAPGPDAGLDFVPAVFSGPSSPPVVQGGVEIPFAGTAPAEMDANPFTRHDGRVVEGGAGPRGDEGAGVVPAVHTLRRGAEVGAGAHAQHAPGASSPVGDQHMTGATAMVREVEFREVFYGREGNYDQVRSHEAPPEREWLTLLRPSLVGGEQSRSLDGLSTLIVTRHVDLTSWLEEACLSLTRTPGTRVVLQIPAGGAAPGTSRRLRGAGFREVRRNSRGAASLARGETPAALPSPWVWWAAGEERCAPSRRPLDLHAAEAGLDPRDRGEIKDDAEAKAARPFLPVEHDPAKWWDTGLPSWVEEMMQQGVRIRPVREPPMADHPFYKWESCEAQLRAIQEADRHLIVGSLEYVPDDEVAWTAANCVVHPWVVVRQGEKWRLCHDYSVGINQFVPTAPFRLPTPWDVRSILKPTSHFAKYDIRDGFFHVPVHPDSRHYMVVRHPGTGRLMRAARLPFGYIESPRLFCGLTEAIADKLRKRAAGKGIYFYVFVDDFLCVGDTEELTIEACSMLEEELLQRGIEWAPHKHRGPATSMEFLGLLLAVVEGEYFISLTRKRRDGLMRLIDEWLTWEEGERRAGRPPRSPPKEVASLLGRLVFASQVVLNGRTYMQAMLSIFKGCTIDWRRGSVSFADSGVRQNVHLPEDFWVDLRWWRHHLLDRYSIQWVVEDVAEAAIVGTDASGWGTGQLAWIDGGREEVQLEFTDAEQRRPINWRELLGVLRTMDFYGRRLSGRTVLLETDNMASKFAAAKGASKAKDMQELIRRLVALCEKYEITLRLTHTPGVKLIRPDQTSRGDPVEEPRLRLPGSFFSTLEARWGRFTSFLGPERAHASRASVGGALSGEHAWMHATPATTGSALRLLTDRADRALQAGLQFSAVALVPDGSGPALSGITRHMAAVSRVPAGQRMLESFGTGAWRSVPAHRGFTLFVYPRPAGDTVLPVVSNGPQEKAALDALFRSGGVSPYLALPGDETRWYVPLIPGCFLYRPGEGDGRGSLYWVDSPYHPRDDPDVLEADHVGVRAALRTNSRLDVQRLGVESYDVKSDGQMLSVSVEGLWVVSHLVDLMDPSAWLPQRARETPDNYARRRDGVRIARYTFDWKAAHREIARAAQSLTPQEAVQVQGEWVLVGDALGTPVSSAGASDGERASPGSSVIILGDPAAVGSAQTPPPPSLLDQGPPDGSGDGSSAHDGSLAAALHELRMDRPSGSAQRPSLALAMMKSPL